MNPTFCPGSDLHPKVTLEWDNYEVAEAERSIQVCAVLSTNLNIFGYVFGFIQTFPAPVAEPAHGKHRDDFQAMRSCSKKLYHIDSYRRQDVFPLDLIHVPV